MNRLTLPTERSERVRPGPNTMGRAGVPKEYEARSDQRDQVNQRHRQDHSRERRQWDPCVACGAAGHYSHYIRLCCKSANKCMTLEGVYSSWKLNVSISSSSHRYIKHRFPKNFNTYIRYAICTRRLTDIDWVGKQRAATVSETSIQRKLNVRLCWRHKKARR